MVQLGPGVNLIIARNGQGKSNFLEALYLVSHATSFRTNHFEELICWGENEASVFVNLQEDTLDTEENSKLGLILRPTTREAYIHGQKVTSLASYLGTFSTVCFSPFDLSLVKGPPGVRRKFLDRQIIHLEPHVTRHLLAYHKALKNKAKLLKSESVSDDELEPWDQLLATEAYQILSARCRCIKLLEREASSYLRKLAPQEDALKLALESELVGSEGEPLSVAEILEIARSKREREIRQKTALVGPHRDDIRISQGAVDARPFASQGQARSISISLKLGTIAILESLRKVSPVVLLDDVESELDEERCLALYDMVLEPDRQVVITGTASHAAIRNRINDFALFHVYEGVIQRQE